MAHPDRALGLDVMQRLAGPAPADPEIAAALDAVLAGDTAHGTRVLTALVALERSGGGVDGPEAPLRGALEDELALLSRRIAEALLVVHGTERLEPPLRGVAAGGRQLGLAVEAVEVALSPREARMIIAVLRPDLTPADRLSRLPTTTADAPVETAFWLRDIVEDPQDVWRSPWVRACAI